MATQKQLGIELLRPALTFKAAAMTSSQMPEQTDGVEEWHIVDNSRQRRPHPAHDEPLVDTTEKMTLRSKRTERLQKKIQKKEGKRLHSTINSFLDLPSELLVEILTYLRPSDLFLLMRVNRSANKFIETHENTISGAVINRRYSILSKVFPLPVLFEKIDKCIHPVLLAPRHQQRLVIHKAPYWHISPADPKNTCSCMACVLAWNNLCLIVDIAHWQKKLDDREPIPMIARGAKPAWNVDLIESTAKYVNKAIRSPLWRARILERHLNTTVRTIVRSAAIRKKNGPLETEVNPSKRLYHLSKDDIAPETDTFLERSGPPSFEFPFTRDNYYTLVSYLPNRRWDEGGWLYYGEMMHERDLVWAKWAYDREKNLLPLAGASAQKAAELVLVTAST